MQAKSARFTSSPDSPVSGTKLSLDELFRLAAVNVEGDEKRHAGETSTGQRREALTHQGHTQYQQPNMSFGNEKSQGANKSARESHKRSLTDRPDAAEQYSPFADRQQCSSKSTAAGQRVHRRDTKISVPERSNSPRMSFNAPNSAKETTPRRQQALPDGRAVSNTPNTPLPATCKQQSASSAPRTPSRNEALYAGPNFTSPSPSSLLAPTFLTHR